MTANNAENVKLERCPFCGKKPAKQISHTWCKNKKCWLYNRAVDNETWNKRHKGVK